MFACSARNPFVHLTTPAVSCGTTWLRAFLFAFLGNVAALVAFRYHPITCRQRACSFWPRRAPLYTDSGRIRTSCARRCPTGIRTRITTQRGIMATPFPALLRSRGRPSPLHRTRGKGSAPPHGPYREGRTAAPRRTLPRTVRSGRDCRLFYAPHSIVTITSSRIFENGCAVGSSREMGRTKTRGVISAAQAEVPSSRPARLPGQREYGHWMERTSLA